MTMPTSNEIVEELRNVLIGPAPIADAVGPPLVFVAVDGVIGLGAGAVAAVSTGLLITTMRLVRKRPVRFALAGLAGTGGAATLAAWSGSAETYFVPGIIGGTLTAFVALISIMARRPMVAWTSMLVRRWPAAWFRHPQVQPAYRDATWLWVAFFAGRAALQWSLARQGELAALAGVRVVGGWPALVVLLVLTYICGTFRLSRLGGPSVEEFRSGTPPPWTGQRRGF